MALTKIHNRMVAGAVANVLDFGAAADGVTDDTTAIQAAIDSGAAKIYFPAGYYITTSPIYIDTDTILFGDGSRSSFITKTTTTAGTGSNVMRASAYTDSYAVNAVVIIRHPDNVFNYNSGLQGLAIHGVNFDVDYGVYAPRCTHLMMNDVIIFRCTTGFFTYDTWMSDFTEVECNSNRTVGGSGATGFRWSDDGSGQGAGTSIMFQNCYARNCDTGYSIYGLSYSTMNACAADAIYSTPYNFSSIDGLAMNGCGTEGVTLGTNTGIINCVSSNGLVVNSFKAIVVTGNTNSAAVRIDSTQATFNSCTFPNFGTVNSAYNLIIQNGSSLVSSSSSFPSNGNGFISYSSDSDWIRLDKTGIKNKDGTYISKKIIENKSIASAGTGIFRMDAPGTTDPESGTLKVQIVWHDDTGVDGMGIINYEVTFLQSGGSYFYDENVISNTAAYSSGASLPTIAASVFGASCTVTMTPAQGDCVCDYIRYEFDSHNGMGLFFP